MLKYFFLSRNDRIDAGCMLLFCIVYGSVIPWRLSALTLLLIESSKEAVHIWRY